MDGLLFNPGDSEDLPMILRRLIAEPNALASLASNVRPLRTFADVSRDFAALYAELCGLDPSIKAREASVAS